MIRATAYIRRLPRRGCLVVVNYHRIGDAASTPYDSGTFSATESEFDEHIRFLKQCFAIVTLEEAISFVRRGAPGRHALALITFDDGYIDNYECAFPILRGHGVQGTFFLPTSFIGSAYIPWWDAIAWQVKTCTRPSLRLTWPHSLELPLNGDRSAVLGELLSIYKQPATNSGRFLAALEEATGVACPASAPERLFMTWDEAAGMAAAGMAFGSHTHTHEVLSKMSGEGQYNEFQTSRELLRRHVGTAPDALAFPVGSGTSFSACTPSCLERAGYRAAFSFYGGVNLPGRANLFDIRRIPGDMDEGGPAFRLRLTLAAATGHTIL